MSGFDVHLAGARRSRFRLFLLAAGTALLLATGMLIAQNLGVFTRDAVAGDHMLVSGQAVPDPDSEKPVSLVAAEHAMFTGPATRPDVRRMDVTVRRGQTFASVLSKAGSNRTDAARAIAALDSLYPANLLRAGQALTLYFETGDEPSKTRLAGLSFRPDPERTLTVSRNARGHFHAREATTNLTREVVRVTGEVSSSLYLSTIELGATDRVVFELANILGFAVDFRTVQPGDPCDVPFERFVNGRGETVRTGDIFYVMFDGRGAPLEYFRYETEDGEAGYYTAEGESARRLLMRMPINGARISSSFGMRFHPVLARNRPHNGTDFAAPRGTPIMATGAGIVERANRFGSFGNYIRIRHANGYQTAYAHLRGFARGIRSGVRVRQGQIIGYVGTTGRSTGPHLHYEVHLNGRPTNPMSLNLPTGRHLTRDELTLFTPARDKLIGIRDQAPLALKSPSAGAAVSARFRSDA